MSLDADHIVDRRRMRRKLTFWRVAAVLIAIVAVVGVAAIATRGGAGLSARPGASIARINIEGLIRANQQRVEALEQLGRPNAAAATARVNNAPVGPAELLQRLDRKSTRPNSSHVALSHP